MAGGSAWQGACVAGGACMAGGHAWHTVGGTHPTGMHSCCNCIDFAHNFH